MRSTKRLAFIVSSVLLVIVIGSIQGCFLFSGRSGDRNLTWEGKKVYEPASVERPFIEGFGLNDWVDVLPTGDLPIRFSRTITNTGTDAVAAGYIVRERLVHWIFQAVGGAAGYVAGPDATHLIFECEQKGPALAPGESAMIEFEIPGTSCLQMNPTLVALTALPCGLYQETLTIDIDDDVAETDEGDNESSHFFFIPSEADIDIVVTFDPFNSPDISSGAAGEAVAMAGLAPGSVAWRLTIEVTPPGTQYRIYGESPVVGPLAGDTGTLIPATPTGFLSGQTILDYALDTNPTYAGACNRFAPDAYEEDIGTKITVISEDGCAIRQRALPTVVWHECF